MSAFIHLLSRVCLGRADRQAVLRRKRPLQYRRLLIAIAVTLPGGDTVPPWLPWLCFCFLLLLCLALCGPLEAGGSSSRRRSEARAAIAKRRAFLFVTILDKAPPFRDDELRRPYDIALVAWLILRRALPLERARPGKPEKVREDGSGSGGARWGRGRILLSKRLFSSRSPTGDDEATPEEEAAAGRARAIFGSSPPVARSWVDFRAAPGAVAPVLFEESASAHQRRSRNSKIGGGQASLCEGEGLEPYVELCLKGRDKDAVFLPQIACASIAAPAAQARPKNERRLLEASLALKLDRLA